MERTGTERNGNSLDLAFQLSLKKNDQKRPRSTWRVWAVWGAEPPAHQGLIYDFTIYDRAVGYPKARKSNQSTCSAKQTPACHRTQGAPAIERVPVLPAKMDPLLYDSLCSWSHCLPRHKTRAPHHEELFRGRNMCECQSRARLYHRWLHKPIF